MKTLGILAGYQGKSYKQNKRNGRKNLMSIREKNGYFYQRVCEISSKPGTKQPGNLGHYERQKLRLGIEKRRKKNKGKDTHNIFNKLIEKHVNNCFRKVYPPTWVWPHRLFIQMSKSICPASSLSPLFPHTLI